MTGSTFNDPQKLADARALANSFKKGHGKDSCQKKADSSRDSFQGHNKVPGAAKGFVKVKELITPSVRHYDGSALRSGWQTISVSSNAPDMAGARNFLARNDEVNMPSVSAASATNRQAEPICSAKTTDISTPPPVMLHNSVLENRISAVYDKNSIDEVNAERLANLLESFSFKEGDKRENPSESILDTFLALLAENSDLTKELEDTKTSCIKESTIADESDNPENSTTDKTGATSTCTLPSKKKSKVDSQNPSTSKNSELRAKAPAFFPSRERDTTLEKVEQLPFTGKFDNPDDNGRRGFWPPSNYNVPALSVAAMPVSYTVWVPIHPLATDYSMNQESIISTPATPMQGLATSRWATYQSGQMD